MRGDLSEVVRVEGGRILAVLAATTGDLQLAEDAVQDAAVAALEVWPRTGAPDDPSAWLYVAARRKAIDVVRRESNRSGRERAATQLAALLATGPPPPSLLRDDTLRLLFTCCHPALAIDARVALALRTLCGLATDEVACVLLVSESTMAKRLVRAKQKIAKAQIPFRIPGEAELPARLAAVAAVVHLVYTAGHHAPRDQVVRAELCDEAIRLARLLVELLPDPTIEALLALLLLTDARRPARLAPDGSLVTLADQDRSRWRRRDIGEGVALLNRSLAASAGCADTYQLQAAIAACHATAASYAATDWPEVLRLYELLAALRPNPAVELNAAVAAGEARGPAAGLARLHAIDERDRSHLWHLARAELLVREGRRTEARADFERALVAAPSTAEHRHIESRLAVTADPSSWSGSGLDGQPGT